MNLDKILEKCGYDESRMVHVLNVIENVKRLILNFIGDINRELAVFVAATHDVGYASGKDNHGPNGSSIIYKMAIDAGFTPTQAELAMMAVYWHMHDQYDNLNDWEKNQLYINNPYWGLLIEADEEPPIFDARLKKASKWFLNHNPSATAEEAFEYAKTRVQKKVRDLHSGKYPFTERFLNTFKSEIEIFEKKVSELG